MFDSAGQGDAYRDAERVYSCGLCNERAVAQCPRCGRPVCLGHLPRDNKHRCDVCELCFASARRSLDTWTGLTGFGALAAGAVAVAFSTAAAFLPLMAMFGAGAGLGIARYLKRQRFLDERGRKLAGLSLAEANIEAAPQRLGNGKSKRRSPDAKHRNRGEPPSRPPSQRTGYYG